MDEVSKMMRCKAYRMALKMIRKNTRESDTLIDTFRIICRNRYSHPVRDWAIFDIKKEKIIDEDSAIRTYNRHLTRLYEIFRVPK